MHLKKKVRHSAGGRHVDRYTIPMIVDFTEGKNNKIDLPVHPLNGLNGTARVFVFDEDESLGFARFRVSWKLPRVRLSERSERFMENSFEFFQTFRLNDGNIVHNNDRLQTVRFQGPLPIQILIEDDLGKTEIHMNKLIIRRCIVVAIFFFCEQPLRIQFARI